MTAIVPLLAAASTLLAAAGTDPNVCTARSGGGTALLVELYTSQGCSSCPPADRWLTSLRPRVEAGELVPLSLHVGYWDYIGWKDPFARREFNERQRTLAAASGSRGVYTPGVFLQGREWRQWSDRAALGGAVAQAVRQPGPSLQLTVVERSADAVVVHAAAAAAGGARLYLALTQDGLQTRVAAGENRGEILRNDYVVRDWHGPLAPNAAPVRLVMPAHAPLESLAAVAVVEEGGAVRQAVRLPLARCR